MGLKVELHPAAVVESVNARRWYADRSEEVAAAFLVELDRVIARISRDPSSLPFHRHGTRRCPLRRFPYDIVFHLREPVVQIIAVAHQRRRPGYWRKRLER